ncbi:MAG: helix-turn-helix domain-containing protein [Acidimicrobiales bacterium]|nr:helix-turn-helix domain-containing protein [Acidimicrobiales bacterium]
MVVASAVGTGVNAIGDTLRAIREQQGLTLEQASAVSGLSKSHLSRLESSERQPSVASLLALATAFGVPVGTFFGETEQRAPLTISPPDQVRRDSNGLNIAICSGYAGSSVLDALRVTVTPDRPPPTPARHPGEEWLYVVRGTLRLEYDGEVHRLGTGSTAHFNAEVAHRLGAERATAEVLLVAAKPVRNISTIH